MIFPVGSGYTHSFTFKKQKLLKKHKVSDILLIVEKSNRFGIFLGDSETGEVGTMKGEAREIRWRPITPFSYAGAGRKGRRKKYDNS